MSVNAEIKEIKHYLLELNRKLDELLEEKELLSMMKISEQSLADFISEERETYSVKDLKARYK